MPKVFVAVPTGPIKEYALLYMFAALKNVDYPPDKLTVNFSITYRNSKDDLFIQKFKNLVDAASLPFEVSITINNPSEEEKVRWGQYYAVICNLHELRKQFLDSDFDYFWVLGGDNPPPRHMLHGLLKVGADVSSGMILQRPNREHDFTKPGIPLRVDTRPMFWVYLWHMNDVQKRMDLDPRLKEKLRACWINLPLFQLISISKPMIIRNVSFGSGCSLVKRRVMEYLGYYLVESAYCSEDLSFLQWVHTLGFKTGLDTGLHCGHFDPNGELY